MSLSNPSERRRCGVSLAAAILFWAATGSAFALEIKTLSSGPQYVSGGDALLQVKPQTVINGLSPTVLVNGVNQSVNFTDAGGGKWVGMVTGLHLHADPSNPGADPNVVSATYGGESSSLNLWNYPNEGPIISGPHETPFICTTNYSELDGSPALVPKNDGALCGVHTHVAYFYSRSSDKAFVPLPAGPYPSGMRTITVPGVGTKPYVVRVETGTINRALYQTAMLHDVRNEPVPTPLNPSDTWNGRLVYKFGGGCEVGWYQQGRSAAPVLSDEFLSKRFATASASLNEMRNNCNDLLSSETVMMVKERFIETYGPVKFTIGVGGSGGSYQANQTADNYPGLLDGIITHATFADVNTTTIFKLYDSRLLKTYFPKRTLTDTKKKAISGYIHLGNVDEMSSSAERIDPAGDFASHFPAGFPEWSTSNTTGVRAGVYDHTRNVYGVDGSGYSLRPIGNVGVQYGLKALLEGKITSADFVHLNKTIGGLDRNLLWQSARATGDSSAIARAYQSGRFVHGGGGLKTTPIIDKRHYRDNVSDIHASIHSFAVRERLKKANGHADNHVIRRHAEGYDFSGFTALTRMEQWLTAIVDDPAPLTSAKVVAKKPVDLVDACKLPSGTIVNELQRPFAGTCAGSSAFPVALTPRIAAGGAVPGDTTLTEIMLRDNIAQCRLRTPVLADYNGKLSTSQLNDLKATVFSGGVCDWKHLSGGQGQQPVQTWSSFGPSPVNRIVVP